MSKRWIAARVGVAGAVAVTVVTAAQLPAGADAGPSTTDVVGVGSDIVQNSLNFLADGDAKGHDGYNTAGNKNRLISIDATSDANGRNAFTDPLLGTPAKLNPTVVLRAGTSPVQRPNGGGAGLTALIYDGKNGKSANLINFVRSPNLPTQTQQNTAQQNLGTGLYTVQFADDKQVIATATTTHAPAALTASQLVDIYDGTDTTWHDVDPSLSNDTIIPLIPQDGAGVQTVFLNALKQAHGGPITLGGNVRKVQQNDPTVITSLSPADQLNAIVPFPVGRYDLLNSGYFLNPATPYTATSPPAPLSAAGVTLEQGTGAFSADLPYYVIFRQSDLDSAKPWQPGGTLNWVRTLFANPGGSTLPFVEGPIGTAILSAAGVTPHYADLGNAVQQP